jgi:hypothetical protein
MSLLIGRAVSGEVSGTDVSGRDSPVDGSGLVYGNVADEFDLAAERGIPANLDPLP